MTRLRRYVESTSPDVTRRPLARCQPGRGYRDATLSADTHRHAYGLDPARATA